ncbi:MAG TPA: hypothetical protein VHR44_01560 [Beijerinckiaceae bacterium]|jgi:hypothetical protein|nr:hypothetical protein [Beijerinckiaceae bacterium]
MNQEVSFANDIRPLFTQIDINHMAFFCDLSSYDDVKTNAQEILQRLQGQGGNVMPPPRGPWSADKIALFQTWVDGGCLP